MDSTEQLSVGRSGSLVVRLLVGGRSLVLKITTDAGRLERARTELQLIAGATGAIRARMPRRVAGHDDHDSVSLVSEEDEPLPSPSAIADVEWAALATALGTLHAAPVPPRPELAILAPATEAAVSSAADFWSGLGYESEARRAVELLLGRADAASAPTTGLVLEHGDCHTENIVRDERGDHRWIDWQEAHLGDGFADLAFLWQRAEFAGGNPPREAIIAAYADARHLRCGPDLRRAIGRAELGLLFVSWPPFMSYGTLENQERMKARLSALVGELG